MNFLAHLLLSNDNEDHLIGNFIADSVRSSQWDNFKPGVIEGIKIHHAIDFFTDHHPIVEESKKRLREKHGKYSPVIVDIMYDHFLAANFQLYSSVELNDFATNCYRLFRQRFDELPEKVQKMLPFMESGNWLYNYSNKAGISNVFNGMGKRASFKNEMHLAADDLYEHYTEFENEFLIYFPRLKEFVNLTINNIRKEKG